MHPPENGSGGPASGTAAMNPSQAKPVEVVTAVKADDLEQLARTYAAAADAEHAAKLARIEARDRLVERAFVGFESSGVRVQKRNCWKLNDEAVAEMTATRAALIEEGKAELVPTVIAVRVGREEE